MRAIIDLGPYALVAAANAVRKVEARRKAPVVLAIGKIEGGERPVACESLPHLLAGCRSGLVVAAKSRGRVLHRVVRLGQFGDERLYCMGWGDPAGDGCRRKGEYCSVHVHSGRPSSFRMKSLSDRPLLSKPVRKTTLPPC